MIAAVMVVGLVAGTLMMLPKPGQQGWVARLGFGQAPAAAQDGDAQDDAAAQDAEETQGVEQAAAAQQAQAPPPVAISPAAPVATPAQTPQQAPPPAPAAAAPVATPAEQAAVSEKARLEEAAAARLGVATNFLRRQDVTNGRAVLQDIVRRYPRTAAARDARSLLAQLPADAPVRRAEVPAGPMGRAGAPVVVPAPAEEEGRRVITGDDLRGGRSPATGPRRTPQIPASLQGSTAPRQPASAAAARDELRVASVIPEKGQLTLVVEYTLASAHSRPVYIGAWVQAGSISRNFGYSKPVAPGSGSARLSLPGAGADVAALRIAFFEQGGAQFFVRDVVLKK